MEEYQDTIESWLIIILGGGGLLFLGWMQGWFDQFFNKSDTKPDND